MSKLNPKRAVPTNCPTSLPSPGKHVLSEKPVAPTLAQAEQLLAFHRSLPQVGQRQQGLGWAAAEA